MKALLFCCRSCGCRGGVPQAEDEDCLLRCFLHDWDDSHCKAILNKLRTAVLNLLRPMAAAIGCARAILIVVEVSPHAGLYYGRRSNQAEQLHLIAEVQGISHSFQSMSRSGESLFAESYRSKPPSSGRPCSPAGPLTCQVSGKGGLGPWSLS